MNVSSMMSALQQQAAAKRVAGGMAANRGNGMLTSANATTGAGKIAASTAISSSAVTAKATSSSSSDTSDITSSDFLTLLVAEMQNQDPTQPTDPNAYIQQLVGVNSLQQLISINSELGSSTTTTSDVKSSTAPLTPSTSQAVSGILSDG